MTDIKIIAALTACHKGNGVSECGECPYVGIRGCMDILGEDALDLINRQRAEIEKAKSEAVREFSEKLKTEIAGLEVKSPNTTYKCGMEDVLYYRMPKIIDRLVEEMGCDNDDI